MPRNPSPDARPHAPQPPLAAARRPRRRPATGAPPPPLPDIRIDDEPNVRPIDWALIRRLLGRLAPYARGYALAISISLAAVVLELLSPLFMKAIVNHATAAVVSSASSTVPGGPAAAAASAADGLATASAADGAMRGLLQIGFWWALTMTAALLLHRACILYMTAAGESAMFTLRRDLFAHLQTLSMSYYDRTRLGRIISRCTSDVSALRDIVVWGLDTVTKQALIMLVAGAMLLAADWRLFLALVWLLPLLVIVNTIYQRRISAAYQRIREGYTRMSTNLAENISGVRVVTAFNRQDWNIDTFNRLQAQNTANVMIASRINGLFQPSLQLIGFAGRVIVLVYGGYLAATGRLNGVGGVVAAYLYWDWFMSPVLTFGTFHNQLMQALAGAERVFNVFDTQPDVRDEPDAKPLPPIRGHVRLEGVTFGYDPARPVLHDIDFEIKPGQTAALVGATGSGKSTIVSLLARFYQPQSGRVLIDGVDLRTITSESLHQQIGLVLQANFLFTGTVMENIRYARPQASDAEVIDAARRLGSHDVIAAMSEGYHTRVGERGASLSLGQRQLVCFTRAYLIDPRLVLLDEATSAVDALTESAVQRALETLLRGRTTFVVAHRLSTVVRSDVILVMAHGRLVERGTHGELLAREGRYAELHREFVAGL